MFLSIWSLNQHEMDEILMGIIYSGVAGWAIWVTRKAFEAHECNRVLKQRIDDLEKTKK